MDKMPKNNSLSLLYAFCTVLLWASSYTFTKVALKFYTPEALGFLRYLFASTGLLVFAVIKKIKRPRLADLPLFLVSGFTGFTLYVYAFNKGSASISPATTSVLVSTAPIITAVIVSIFYKEKIKKLAWLAIIMEFFGIIMITFNEGIYSMNQGVFWVLVAALAIATYNAWQRRILKYYKPIEATTYSIFAGSLLLIIFAREGLTQLAAAPPLQVLNAINLGILPGAVAYLLWSIAIAKSTKVTNVTNFMFLIPFLSTIISMIVIKEVPSVITVVGGIIIVASSILFQKFNRDGPF